VDEDFQRPLLDVHLFLPLMVVLLGSRADRKRVYTHAGGLPGFSRKKAGVSRSAGPLPALMACFEAFAHQ
jgi:hypothetical protein